MEIIEIVGIITAIISAIAVLIALLKDPIIKSKKKKSRYEDIRQMFLSILETGEMDSLLPNYILSLSNKDILGALKCKGFKTSYVFILKFETDKKELSLENNRMGIGNKNKIVPMNGVICSIRDKVHGDVYPHSSLNEDNIKYLKKYIKNVNLEKGCEIKKWMKNVWFAILKLMKKIKKRDGK